MQESINFTHILSAQKAPGCPDQLEYVEIGTDLGSVGLDCSAGLGGFQLA